MKGRFLSLCNKAAPKEADRGMQVFLHTLFLKYATETEGNKCKAAFYTYKQISMRSLELFWPRTILEKNLGDILARGLSITLSVLLAPMNLIAFLWSLLWFSCNKSISMFFPEPPFQNPLSSLLLKPTYTDDILLLRGTLYFALH